MILKLNGNNRKSTSGRKDCIKRKNTELKSSVLNIKFGYKAKAKFSGAVYFRDALCNDTPRRKGKIGCVEFNCDKIMLYYKWGLIQLEETHEDSSG